MRAFGHPHVVLRYIKRYLGTCTVSAGCKVIESPSHWDEFVYDDVNKI